MYWRLTSEPLADLRTGDHRTAGCGFAAAMRSKFPAGCVVWWLRVCDLAALARLSRVAFVQLFGLVCGDTMDHCYSVVEDGTDVIPQPATSARGGTATADVARENWQTPTGMTRMIQPNDGLNTGT